MLLIWTEKEPDGTAWRDCTYCSLLMVLEAHGKAKFPLGARTHAERKAFRAADPRDNFTGGVSRSAARYGITPKNLRAAGPAQLKSALSVSGNAFAIAGRLSNFPKGHPLRAFAPNFTGFHAVSVVPNGEGRVRWMDPLAPMNTIPKTVPVSDVLTFAAGNYPNDARYLPVEEDMDQLTKIVEKDFPEGPRIATIPAGPKEVVGYDSDSAVKSQVWPVSSNFQISGSAIITQTPQIAPNGFFYKALNGLYAGLYLAHTDIIVGAPVNPPPAPADCSAVEEELAKVKVNLAAVMAVNQDLNEHIDEIETATKQLVAVVGS